MGRLSRRPVPRRAVRRHRMTSAPASTFRLVRLSPAHPLWHLERVGAEQTECGRGWREPIRHTLTEPLPTPRCTTCGPKMVGELAQQLTLEADPELRSEEHTSELQSR